MKKSIILNGRRVFIDQQKLSYEEVICLCGEAARRSKLLFTIIYKCETSEGTVSPGESVGVVDGMIINCGYTDNS